MIVGLTFANFLFILHTVGPGLQLDKIPLQISARGPASEEPVFEEITLDKTPTLSVKCKEAFKDMKMETLAPTFRIKFYGCPEIERIFNATNTSQGDLFKLKDGWLTSDFILLNKGHNDVFIEFPEKTIKIEVHRENEKENLPASTI